MAIQSMPEPAMPSGAGIAANETNALKPGAVASRTRRGDPAEAAAKIVAETGPDKDAKKAAGRADGTLVIGREIKVKGEIGSCQVLVVEGQLEASTSVGTLKVAEAGLFAGEAQVQEAEIAGRFEGELEVLGELRLTPTARVEGRIRYGRIVIESGGEISGEISVLKQDG